MNLFCLIIQTWGHLLKRFKGLMAEVTQLNLPRVSNHGEPSEATRASQTNAGGLCAAQRPGAGGGAAECRAVRKSRHLHHLSARHPLQQLRRGLLELSRQRQPDVK